MGLFGKKKSKKVEGKLPSTNVGSATIVAKGSKFSGSLAGNDTVHVDGEIEGDVVVNNTVVVGKSGVVNGNIKAQQVICSGQIDGLIECKSFEVLQQAKASYKILADMVIIDGEYKGEIVANKILVDTHGVVSNKIQAKEIVVKGIFEGDLSCELLTTKVTGKIKGNMYAKSILNEGGLVEGSIGQFKDLFVKELESKEEKDKDVEDVEIEEEKVSKNSKK